jgi:hypothetical protein
MSERIRLADLVAPAPEVELPDGTVHRVRRLDGVTASLWYDWQQTPTEARDPRILWQMAARCLPGATEEQVQSLTPEEAGAVIAVAAGNVDKVMAVLKNGLRLETASPASSPETPSAPSSSPSPETPAAARGTSP